MNRDALGEQSPSSHVHQASVTSRELDRPRLLQHLEPPKNLIAGHPCWVVINASLDVVASRPALQRHGHELSSDVRNGQVKPLMRTLGAVRNCKPATAITGYLCCEIGSGRSAWREFLEQGSRGCRSCALRMLSCRGGPRC